MTVKELRARLARKASRAILGGLLPPEDPLASWFGKVRVALPDESWPISDGVPMQGLLQVNVAELPYCPDALTDIAMIAVFVDAEKYSYSGANGDHWLLRAYAALDGLVPIADPMSHRAVKSFPIRWELVDADYPPWDYASEMDVPAKYEGDYSDRFPTLEGTKIGGWPLTVQSEIRWQPHNDSPTDPEFVFQIDTEQKADWMWGDTGTGYFGRGGGNVRDQWMFEWQCC